MYILKAVTLLLLFQERCSIVNFYPYFYKYNNLTTLATFCCYNASDCWVWCNCGAHGLSSSSHRALAEQEVVVGWFVGANVVPMRHGMSLGIEMQVGLSWSSYTQSWAVCSQQSSLSIRPLLRTHEPTPQTPGGRTEGSMANVLKTQIYRKNAPSWFSLAGIRQLL